MENGQEKRKHHLRTGAKVSLIVLLLYVIGQLVSVYQTRAQLTSPLISESIMWEINRNFVLTALVISILSLVALILYFFEKYVLVLALATLTLLFARLVLVNYTLDF